MVEQMLGDWSAAHPERSAISLRYFNPAGAHPSGLIGEDPLGQPNDWNAINETLYLLSVPGMRESIIDGMQENLDETSTELEW